MPLMTFDGDDASGQANERPRGHLFCHHVAHPSENTVPGSWLHPHHNWYLTLDHGVDEIDATLTAADAAFAEVAAEYGAEK